MSNVVPIYPNAIFTWVDRIDQVNIDFANDINSVASDLISVEQTLGANPQVEKSPPNGLTSVSYASVDSRISDAMGNVQMPVCVLRSSPFVVSNTTAGETTPFYSVYDPYGIYNGTDITIKVNGWYFFTVHQTWSWWNDGYSHTYLNSNGNLVEEDLIDWNFSGNNNNTASSTPRWQQFGLRPRIAHLSWQGRCAPGDRISVVAENGTSNTRMQVTYTAFKVHMAKTLPSSLASNIQ